MVKRGRFYFGLTSQIKPDQAFIEEKCRQIAAAAATLSDSSPPGWAMRTLTPASAANAALKARLSPADLVIVVVGTHAELGAEIRNACGPLASETVVPYMDVE